MQESLNPMVLAQMEEDKQKLFEIATLYKNFSEEIENKDNKEEKKNNKVYIISKELTDNIKKIIKYEETEKFLTKDDKNEEKLNEFKEKLKDLTIEDLDSIFDIEIKVYSDLEGIQEDISQGFDFVDSNFLDKFDIEENLDDNIVKYYKEQNNICIEFDDKSKLLINKENDQYKYHAIDPPYKKKTGNIELKRTKTVSFATKRCKTKREKLINNALTSKINNKDKDNK